MPVTAKERIGGNFLPPRGRSMLQSRGDIYSTDSMLMQENEVGHRRIPLLMIRRKHISCPQNAMPIKYPIVLQHSPLAVTLHTQEDFLLRRCSSRGKCVIEPKVNGVRRFTEGELYRKLKLTRSPAAYISGDGVSSRRSFVLFIRAEGRRTRKRGLPARKVSYEQNAG